MERLVVVGASLAGLRAVEAARKAGFAGAVTLVGAEDHLPYDRPPLSKAFLDAADEPVVPTYRTHAELAALDVQLLLGAPATGLDTVNREVLIGDTHVGYDALVIATGASARTLPGAETLAGVHTLRTVQDAQAIRKALDAGARTVVIGAGFIGSEVASAARKRGLQVTVVEALPTPLVRAVGEVMGASLSALHTAHGTDLRCGVAVAELLGSVSVTGVRLADGEKLDADLVVVGAGASPSTAWLESSGLALDDGVVCDQYLQTSAPGVYAAGDVARWHNPLFDRTMRLEHWTSAAEQGARAARNSIAPAQASHYETVPYFWSDWYDARIQFVGVAEADQVVVYGDPSDGGFVALYCHDDRLTGALAVDRPSETMKYRRMIASRTSWTSARAFAQGREGM